MDIGRTTKIARRSRTAGGKLACKIELPGRERDVRTDRLPNGHLCLFVFTNRRMHLSAFLTWCDHDAFSQGDGCLDSPSHLRSDPAVNSRDSGCEGVTEHTDRDSHYEIFKKVLKYRHSASPLSVKSRAARVIQFYRQGRNFSRR